MVTAISAIVYCPQYCCNGAVSVQVKDWCGLEQELPVITKAAERNGVRGEDFFILLAVRKAENGPPGRQFGIIHPIAKALINIQPQNSLDIQAGWAAATIVKNRRRWKSVGRSAAKRRDLVKDGPGDFIDFLGDRYCPAVMDADGNKNWKENVRYWYGRFKS